MNRGAWVCSECFGPISAKRRARGRCTCERCAQKLDAMAEFAFAELKRRANARRAATEKSEE